MGVSFSPGEFADDHGLLSELLPYEHKRIDPVTHMRQFDEWLEDAEPYQATVTPQQVFNVEMQRSTHRLSRTLFLLRGGWPIRVGGNHQSSRSRWVVPTYAHLEEADNLQCQEDRTQHARDCARLGVITDAEIAARYGCSRRTIQRETEQPWGEARLQGRERLVRTLHTISAWRDLHVSTVANWVGQTRHWVWNFKKRHLPAWEPPSRPSETEDSGSDYSVEDILHD